MENIIRIVIGILIGFLFFSVKHFFTRPPIESGSLDETFQISKFKKGFILNDPVLWIKSIFEIIDLRKIVIYTLIIGSVLIYGYNQGYLNRPVKVDLGYGKEAIINLGNGEYMHITKDGDVHIQSTADPKDPIILRQIKIKDIPNLKKLLSPIGLQFRPIIVAGYGIGTNGDNGVEVGAGVSFFRFYKMQLDAFLTQKGMYVGTSYNITDNAGIGIGVGTDYKFKDGRVIVYGRVRF